MSVIPITPSKIELPKVKAAVDRGLRATGEIIKVDYKLFTATWESENMPEWTEKLFTHTGTRIWEYWTKSTPFTWVDLGTKGPYQIPKAPKASGFLAFQSGFIPKTTPGSLMSGSGAHFGPMAFAKQVTHPGIEPRGTSERALKDGDKHIGSLVQKNLDAEKSL